MDVSSFFSRLVQPAKASATIKQPDDLADFEAAWKAIQETLEYPDERQLVRGISSTAVPDHLRHIVDALVYESNRTDEDETGACFEYFLRQDVLSNLEKLCGADQPHGIKREVLRAINNLIVLLSDRFLIHNAVHRPLRRLLRTCVGDDAEDKAEEFVRVFGAAGMDQRKRMAGGEADFEADLVDLMCILCSKMRAYPPLLLIFFHDKGWFQSHDVIGPAHSDNLLSRVLSPTPSTQTSRSHPSAVHSQSSKTGHRFEFHLFSYLLRFVHREGRTGDFARAGLLFLFDIAFLGQDDTGSAALQTTIDKSGSDPLQDAREALGEYILDGDFAEVMAAAIGAVYSLLPSKLKVPTLADQAKEPDGTAGGMCLGMAASDMKETEDIPSSDDPTVHSQLDLLLKLFGFLQDIITRCSFSSTASSTATLSSTQLLGTAISDITLEAIQTSFLDNVLYPSILESSSADGTSVAVMTYLQVLLSNLDDGPLLSRMLHSLLDADSDHAPVLAQHHRPKRTTGAVSYVQHGNDRHTDYVAEGGKFTMKDLIIDNISSSSPAARVSALQLLNTMLQEHCNFAVDHLISVKRIPVAVPAAPQSSSSTSQLYASLLTQIDSAGPLFDQSSSYSAYLADLTSVIQSDRCFCVGTLDDREMDPTGRLEFERHKRHIPADHTTNPDDAVIQQLMQDLAGFLVQTADQNIALSSVIISLASCSRRSLGGWLLRESDEADPWDQQATGQEQHGSYDSRSYSTDINEDEAVPPQHLPAVYTILLAHIEQIQSLRKSIAQLDQLLSERRQGLLFPDNLDEAITTSLHLDSDAFAPGPAASPSHTPLRPQVQRGRSSLAGSIKGFFTPKKKAMQSNTPVENRLGGINPPAMEGGPNMERSPYNRHYEIASGLKFDIGNLSAGPDHVDQDGDVFTDTLQIPRAIRRINGLENSTSSASTVNSSQDAKAGIRERESAQVSLNQILDNVVILEEFLKEIIAVINIRRAMGIDAI